MKMIPLLPKLPPTSPRYSGSVEELQLHGLPRFESGESWTVGGTREAGSVDDVCDAWEAGSGPDHAALYGTTNNCRVKFPSNLKNKMQNTKSDGPITVTFYGKEVSQIPIPQDKVELPGEASKYFWRSGELVYRAAEDCDVEFAIGGATWSRQRAAEMVAVTAIMRKIEGFPATDLRLDDKVGVCCGTGMRISIASAIVINLGGYFWGNLEKPNYDWQGFDARADELSKVRQLVYSACEPELTGLSPAEKGEMIVRDIKSWLTLVEAYISRYFTLMKRVSRVLLRKGRVSAAQFDFLVRNDHLRRSGDMARNDRSLESCAGFIEF